MKRQLESVLTRRLGGLALLLAVACGPANEPRASIGETAPHFTLSTLTDERFRSQDLLGRPVVLNFWATWCRPCRQEIPELNELDAEGAVEVVSIALDEEGARAVAPFVAQEAIGYRVLLGDQRTFERFDGFALPYTLALDEGWTVRAKYRGPVSRELLLRDLGLPPEPESSSVPPPAGEG